MIKRKRKLNKQAIIKGLVFYKVGANDSLLVHDLIQGVYAPFTFNIKRCKLSTLLEWWGDNEVISYMTLNPTELLDVKNKGMVKIQ